MQEEISVPAVHVLKNAFADRLNACRQLNLAHRIRNPEKRSPLQFDNALRNDNLHRIDAVSLFAERVTADPQNRRIADSLRNLQPFLPVHTAGDGISARLIAEAESLQRLAECFVRIRKDIGNARRIRIDRQRGMHADDDLHRTAMQRHSSVLLHERRLLLKDDLLHAGMQRARPQFIQLARNAQHGNPAAALKGHTDILHLRRNNQLPADAPGGPRQYARLLRIKNQPVTRRHVRIAIGDSNLCKRHAAPQRSLRQHAQRARQAHFTEAGILKCALRNLLHALGNLCLRKPGAGKAGSGNDAKRLRQHDIFQLRAGKGEAADPLHALRRQIDQAERSAEKSMSANFPQRSRQRDHLDTCIRKRGFPHARNALGHVVFLQCIVKKRMQRHAPLRITQEQRMPIRIENGILFIDPDPHAMADHPGRQAAQRARQHDQTPAHRRQIVMVILSQRNDFPVCNHRRNLHPVLRSRRIHNLYAFGHYAIEKAFFFSVFHRSIPSVFSL